MDFATLAHEIGCCADGLRKLGLNAHDRVAVYLPKRIETVVSFFAAAHAGSVFVPVNPLLKPRQVAYIMQDCNARILITSHDRLRQVEEALHDCDDLHTIIVLDGEAPSTVGHVRCVGWDSVTGTPSTLESQESQQIDSDMAAILYTSGSTGNPKGVVLSHRNLIEGARSVSTYLKNTSEDTLLAVLPFSFDYGLSQLTTAFMTGASVVLMDYLLPRDVIKAVARYHITGLAAVPPLWIQLADLEWPAEAVECLRYITNSGGAMPVGVTKSLREALPDTEIFLMYGLTEAFRSTYLEPEQVDSRPESMGKAIPNAQVMVVREDGSECAPGEPGELVHRGPHVAMGYWNDPEKTRQRFKPAPGQPSGITNPELAVWSGDKVRRDDDGYLYFITRDDEMIKTSGYRVSPTEVEEMLYAIDGITEVAVMGITDAKLGQAIVAVIVGTNQTEDVIINGCKQSLPNYMVPHRLVFVDSLPKNANGKLDRRQIMEQLQAAET